MIIITITLACILVILTVIAGVVAGWQFGENEVTVGSVWLAVSVLSVLVAIWMVFILTSNAVACYENFGHFAWWDAGQCVVMADINTPG